MTNSIRLLPRVAHRLNSGAREEPGRLLPKCPVKGFFLTLITHLDRTGTSTNSGSFVPTNYQVLEVNINQLFNPTPPMSTFQHLIIYQSHCVCKIDNSCYHTHGGFGRLSLQKPQYNNVLRNGDEKSLVITSAFKRSFPSQLKRYPNSSPSEHPIRTPVFISYTGCYPKISHYSPLKSSQIKTSIGIS